MNAAHPDKHLRRIGQLHTVLLADDSENDLFLMRKAFDKAEFEVTLQEVRSGEEAIAYLQGDGAYCDRSRYALPVALLLDLNMATMSGFDVLTWVRAQQGLKRLCVIVLSASMRTEDVERAFDAGASAFLVKPRSLDQLITMIRTMRDWIRINEFPSLGSD